MFSVAAENVDCFNSGVICRKSLLINIGRSFIAFDDDTGKPVRVAFQYVFSVFLKGVKVTGSTFAAGWIMKLAWILEILTLFHYFENISVKFKHLFGLQNPSSMVDRKQRMFIWPAGYFTVVHFPEEDVTVLWDRKTTVHIQVGPRWQVGRWFRASTQWSVQGC